MTTDTTSHYQLGTAIAARDRGLAISCLVEIAADQEYADIDDMIRQYLTDCLDTVTAQIERDDISDSLCHLILADDQDSMDISDAVRDELTSRVETHLAEAWDLIDYATGEVLRPATRDEVAQSLCAGPEGVIAVAGRSCYAMHA